MYYGDDMDTYRPTLGSYDTSPSFLSGIAQPRRGGMMSRFVTPQLTGGGMDYGGYGGYGYGANNSGFLSSVMGRNRTGGSGLLSKAAHFLI